MPSFDDLAPSDSAWAAREFEKFRREIDELRASRRAAATTISDPDAEFVVRGGAEFSVLHETTDAWLLHVGKGTLGKYFLTARRDNNTVALEIGTLSNGAQFWGMRDNANRIIASDDAVSGTGLARPWIPIVVYPQFTPTSPAAGVTGYHAVAPGTLAKWEGWATISHPKLQLIGIWGQASGANNTTYHVWLDGNSVGTWTKNGTFAKEFQGPFDVSAYIGDWVKVEVGISASSGTGLVAVQPLGIYLRQS